MRATTRGTGGSQKKRLGIAVATAMAVALSLSGFALANELPRTHISAPTTILGVHLTPRPGRVPPLSPTFTLHTVTRKSATERRPAPKSLHRPYTLPVARHLIDRSQLDRPHHDYRAWDLAVPVGTKVIAVRGGVVKEVTRSGSCGNGVILVGTDDFVYTYCHGSQVKVRAGDKVATGDPIMLSGSSGHSTGPHLHLQIESPLGFLVCPQSLVTSWFNGSHAAPTTATSTGCFYVTSKHHHRKHDHHHRSGHAGTGIGDGGLGAAGSGETSTGTASLPTPTPSPSPSPTRTPKPQPPPAPSPSPTPLPSPSPSLT